VNDHFLSEGPQQNRYSLAASAPGHKLGALRRSATALHYIPGWAPPALADAAIFTNNPLVGRREVLNRWDFSGRNPNTIDPPTLYLNTKCAVFDA